MSLYYASLNKSALDAVRASIVADAKKGMA